MPHRVFTLIVLAVGCSFANIAAGVTVSLSPSRDTTLYAETDKSQGNSLGSYLFTGTTLPGVARRTLLGFDIAGSIPSGATITSVELQLTMSRAQTFSGQTTSLHAVTSPWGEGTSDALGEEGEGIAATPGDATWQANVLGTSVWTTPGGDFNSLVSTSQVVTGLGAVVWPSTAAAVADVQSWLNNPAGNHGWVVLGMEDADGTAKRFNSRQHPDVATRPTLTVSYTVVPEPASLLVLLGAGLMGVSLTRKFR